MKNLLSKIYEGRWGYLFLLPAYIFFSAFFIYPIIDALRLSFYETSLTTDYFVGFNNFIRLLQDSVFHMAIRNTIIFVIGVVPTIIVISLFVSVIVYPLGKKIHTFVRFSFYMPVVAGAVVLALVWNYIYHPTFGFLNYILALMGFDRITWLGEPGWALFSLIIVVITWTMGEPIILFLASMGSIPQQLWDSADIDGATSLQKFWHVTLPLLKPTALFVLVTRTIGVFQVFVVIQILTMGGPGSSTQSVVFRIWQTSFQFYDFGYAAAMSVVLLIMVTIIGVFQIKLLGGEVEY